MSWVALSKTEHFDKALGPKRSFNYAKSQSIVEICTFELQSAVTSFPIVFMNDKNAVKICCLLGLMDNESLFVTPDGNWEAKMLPAAIQIFPFRMGRLESGERLLLFDEKSDLIVDRVDGAPFFDEEGQVTDVVKKTMQLLTNIHASSVTLSKASAVIKDLELLEPFKFKLQKSETETIDFGGWMRINIEAFNSLSESKFLELKRVSGLDVIYAHIYSMNNMFNLVQKLGDKVKMEAQLKGLGNKIFEDEPTIDFNFD